MINWPISTNVTVGTVLFVTVTKRTVPVVTFYVDFTNCIYVLYNPKVYSLCEFHMSILEDLWT